MDIFIGIVVIVVLIVGFMYANDISERKSYEEMREELGEKFKKKSKKRIKTSDGCWSFLKYKLSKQQNYEKDSVSLGGGFDDRL